VAGLIPPARVVNRTAISALARRHEPPHTRIAIEARAAWLALLTLEGVFDCHGVLRRDVWDPFERRVIRAKDDLHAYRSTYISEPRSLKWKR
jgi:hypothetical protein